MLPPCNQDFLNYKGRFRYLIIIQYRKRPHTFEFLSTALKKDPCIISNTEILIHHLNLMTLDSIPLIRQYLKFYNDQQGRNARFSKKALKALLSYDLPGNIRGLKNTIERNVLLAEEDIVTEVDLGNEFRQFAVEQSAEPESQEHDIIIHSKKPGEYTGVFDQEDALYMD